MLLPLQKKLLPWKLNLAQAYLEEKRSKSAI